MTKCFNQSCFIQEVDCIESVLSHCLEKSLLAMEKVEMTEIIPKMSSFWMVMGRADFMCVRTCACARACVCGVCMCLGIYIRRLNKLKKLE